MTSVPRLDDGFGFEEEPDEGLEDLPPFKVV